MGRTLTISGKRKPYIMAHRGNRSVCPENTLAAFKQAFADGADILETDLHLSRDEDFICIHDESLDRTTDTSGLIAEMTTSEIKRASAWNGMPGFEDERVPLLEETAAILPTDVALALELKSDRFLEESVCEKLMRDLHTLGVYERTIILSFNPEHLATVKKVDADIPRGLITMRRIFPPLGYAMVGPAYPLVLYNPIYMLLAKIMGQMVCPLDPAPEERLHRYVRMRCDAVITDDALKTRKAVDKLLAK